MGKPTDPPLERIAPVPITMNGIDDEENTAIALITNVLVGDYHEITGDVGKPYVVWQIKITLGDSDYSSIHLYKRYLEFEQFRRLLIEAFPDDRSTIASLPAKDNFAVNRVMQTRTWLEKRRRGLQWFLSNVLLNPKYQKLAVVTLFLLSRDMPPPNS